MLHGIMPGPLLFENSGDLVYAIFAALIIANFAMLAMEYFGMRMFVRLLKIPKRYLLPVIIALCVVGSFGLNNRIFDVMVTFLLRLPWLRTGKTGISPSPRLFSDLFWAPSRKKTCAVD